jgi:hypothetical protein
MKTSELYEWTSDQYHYPDTTVVNHQPSVPIRIRNVELLSDVGAIDIAYVQVANVLLAKFSRDIPVCFHTNVIHIIIQRLPHQVMRTESLPAPFKVRITADRL